MLVTMFIPIIGGAVAPVMTVFCTLVGLRCALAARGHRNEADPGRLLRSSVAFFLLSYVVFLLIDGLFMGLYSIVGPVRGLSSFRGNSNELSDVIEALFNQSFMWYLLVGTRLALPLIYAAFVAVPMAASAVSSSTRGRQSDLIWGLGAGAFSVGVPLIFWGLGGHILALCGGELWTTIGMAVSSVFALLNGYGNPWSISVNPFTLFGGTLLMTWASSWFFATAVLAWEREVQRQGQARANAAKERQADSGDIRSLREARTQRNSR